MHTYLVDGYNLIYQIPELAERDSEEMEFKREKLIGKLISFSAGRSFSFHLIFDSSRIRHGRQRHPGVLVDYASPSADAFIRDIIARNPDNPHLTVVTSDRKDIGNFAQVSGLKWLTSEEFWQRMAAPPQTDRSRSNRVDETDYIPPGWSSKDDAWLKRSFED